MVEGGISPVDPMESTQILGGRPVAFLHQILGGLSGKPLSLHHLPHPIRNRGHNPDMDDAAGVPENGLTTSADHDNAPPRP